MNLSKLFEIQKQLDDRIVEEHGLQGQDLLKKKTVALLTELFECVNEARFFKFWSKDQKPRTEEPSDWDFDFLRRCGVDIEPRNPLLEEYVDTIHFALSIANDSGLKDYKYRDPGDHDLNLLTIGLTNMITLLPENNYHRFIEKVLHHLIKLGYQLGFCEKQVIVAYYDKNKINHDRQESGY